MQTCACSQQLGMRRYSEPIIPSRNIGSMVEQIASIDAEISRTEEVIVHLVKQRAGLKRKRNTFSPIIRLPSEVVSLIFEFACLPKEDDHLGSEGYIGGQRLFGLLNLGMGVGIGAATPLFLGSICTAWRDIAFVASQLWNTVAIRLNEKQPHVQASLLRNWLSRARQRPLWIKVIEHDSNENEKSDDDTNDSWGIEVTSTAIIDVLAEYSTQWHTIDFFLPNTWKRPLSRIRHALPNLTSVTLRPAEESPTLSPVDAFALTPQLRNVTLIGYSISDVSLPWAQLEKIDAEYFSVREALDMLRLCPSLRRSQFTQLFRHIAHLAAQPIRHERLEALELILDTSHQLQTLFGAMTLPNLRELVLSLSDDEPLFGAVMPLLRRSGCAALLAHLHLVGVTPTEEDLVGCLKELVGLEALLLINPVMSGGKLTDRFLTMMSPSGGSGKAAGRRREDGEDGGQDKEGCLVPRLEQLEYQGPIAFNPRALVEMLTSRWSTPTDQSTTKETPAGSVAQLKSVVLTTERQIVFGGDDAKVVQRLMGEGMRLQFHKDPNAPGW